MKRLAVDQERDFAKFAVVAGALIIGVCCGEAIDLPRWFRLSFVAIGFYFAVSFRNRWLALLLVSAGRRPSTSGASSPQADELVSLSRNALGMSVELRRVNPSGDGDARAGAVADPHGQESGLLTRRAR